MIKRIIVLFRKAAVLIGSALVNGVKFWYHGVKYEQFPRTRGKLLIGVSSDSKITFGSNVSINSGKKRNPVGKGTQTSLLAIRGGEIRIGNNVGISNAAIVSMNSIVIEDNVLIGNGAVIYDTDFHSMSYEKRIQHNDDDITTRPVKICEGAFIGAGAMILKGVTVGKHSIIGAGSVVTKDVPPYQIWAGNPAKYIKDTKD